MGCGRRTARPRPACAGDAPLQAQAELVFESWDAALDVVPSASYLMINGSISIPPGAVGDVESRTCALPAGAKFWRLTMRTYKQGTLLQLLDGGSVLL